MSCNFTVRPGERIGHGATPLDCLLAGFTYAGPHLYDSQLLPRGMDLCNPKPLPRPIVESYLKLPTTLRNPVIRTRILLSEISAA